MIADPYPTYHAMRELAPLVKVGGVWYVTTYALADTVLKDQSFGRGERYAILMRNALGDGPLLDSLSKWILYLDPPDHTRIRSLVMRAFTPRAVSRLRAVIQTMVDELVDELDSGARRTSSATSPTRCRSRSSASCSAFRPTIAKSSRPGPPTSAEGCRS